MALMHDEKFLEGVADTIVKTVRSALLPFHERLKGLEASERSLQTEVATLRGMVEVLLGRDGRTTNEE